MEWKGTSLFSLHHHYLPPDPNNKAHTRTYALQTLSNKPQGPNRLWVRTTNLYQWLLVQANAWKVTDMSRSIPIPASPIIGDYLLYRIVLSKKDFSYLGKLTKFPNMPRILLFAHPVPCPPLLCGREGWPNRLHQRFPCPLISTWVWEKWVQAMPLAFSLRVHVRAGWIYPSWSEGPPYPNLSLGLGICSSTNLCHLRAQHPCYY